MRTFMKTWLVSFFFFLTSLSAQAWVNDVFFMKVRIKSFDQKVIRIESSSRLLEIPREAIPAEYKLVTSNEFVNLPILTARLQDMKMTPVKPNAKAMRIIEMQERQLRAIASSQDKKNTGHPEN